MGMNVTVDDMLLVFVGPGRQNDGKQSLAVSYEA